MNFHCSRVSCDRFSTSTIHHLFSWQSCHRRCCRKGCPTISSCHCSMWMTRQSTLARTDRCLAASLPCLTPSSTIILTLSQARSFVETTGHHLLLTLSFVGNLSTHICPYASVPHRLTARPCPTLHHHQFVITSTIPLSRAILRILRH